MAAFNGNALDALREWLTRGDTVAPATTGPNLGSITVTGTLTDTQLRATAVPVSGTFWQATQPVSGTFWQATQPVSGTFWQATQPVSGTVTASPVLATLTDRSGTITAGGTAQQAMAALATRKYLLLQNISDTAMWFNFTTTAVADSPSLYLPVGASFVMEGSLVSTEAVSIFCVTTGKKWTAKEG